MDKSPPKIYPPRRKALIQQTHQIAVDGEELAFSLKRSHKRRSLAVCINETADVVVYAPSYIKDSDIFGFLREKQRWLKRKLEQIRGYQIRLRSQKYDEGGEFLFLGKKSRLSVKGIHGKRPTIAFNGTGWTVGLPIAFPLEERERAVREKLIGWYREQAEEILGSRIFYHSRITGLVPEKIAVRTQKRMWGCCNFRDRIIRLNWQVILSPMAVIDYVIIHELCHLSIPNHSKRFWNKVEKFMPDYKEHKRWLKEHTPALRLP